MEPETKKFDNKLIIVPIVSISLFLVLIFAGAFAFFPKDSTYATVNYRLNMPKGTNLNCVSTNCSATIAIANMSPNNVNSTTAKNTSTCRLNCTCTGSSGASCKYNIRLMETGVTKYVPSTGLGTNKEFTAKVTIPTGCTVQNSSTTEQQVNKLTGKIIANCTLSVPAAGTKSANLAVAFKWYNLDLNQISQSGKTYTYQLQAGVKEQTIYRYSSVQTAIGSNISVLNGNYLNEYTAELGPFYLKHVVVDGIIKESYACVRYFEYDTEEEACVRGGNPSFLGTYDGISGENVYDISSLNPTENFAVASSFRSFIFANGGSCAFNIGGANCTSSTYILVSESNGSVITGINEGSGSPDCYIAGDGLAACRNIT